MSVFRLRRAREEAAQPPHRTIPTVAFLLIAIVSSAVGLLVGFTVWRSSGDLSGAAKATTQAESVKAGITAGVAVGGLFALWIQTRRQRTEERRQSLDEEKFRAESHLRREELTTDLYIKAVAYLGDQNPSIQIGGLYALARIADTTPGEQQRIVDTLCSFLRFPFSPQSTDEGDRGRVVAAVIEVLQDRLDINARVRWRDIDLDLSGNAVAEVSLTHIQIRSLQLHNCKIGVALRLINCEVATVLSIHSTEIQGPLVLGGTEVGDRVWIQDVTIRGHLHCEGVNFTRGLTMSRCAIDGLASFEGGHAGGRVDIQDCHFDGGLSLDDGQFDNSLMIRSSKVTNGFTGSTARFRSRVTFTESEVQGDFELYDSKFDNDLVFDVVEFGAEVNLRNAVIAGDLTVGDSAYSTDLFVTPPGYELSDNGEVVRSTTH
jgi:hypothetical protein